MKKQKGTNLATASFTVLFVILFCCISTTTTVFRINQLLASEKEKTNSSYQGDIEFVPFPEGLRKYEVYPWEMLKLADFNNSYKALVGSRIKEKWLRLLDGPSTKNKMVAASEGNFIIMHSCKQHYCDTHFILILFNPLNSRSWGMLAEGGETVWLGDPDSEMKLLLKKIGKATWPNIPSNRFNQ